MRSESAFPMAVSMALAVAMAAAPAIPAAALTAGTVPLGEMCSATSALGLTFGSKRDASLPQGMFSYVTRKLDSRFAPFAEADLGYTKYSSHFWNAAYSGTFADPDDAMAAADTLAVQAEALGWHPVTGPEDMEELFEYRFSSKPEPVDPPPADETSLSIMVVDSAVIINCENAAFAAMGFQEALGRMPSGTPRPQLADYTATAVEFNIGDCDDPVKRAEFQAMMDGPGRAALSPQLARAAFEDDLASWKIMKLTSSGKITYDEVTDKIIGLLADPESLKNLENATEMMTGIDEDFSTMDPGDEASMCRGLMKMMARAAAVTSALPDATGDAITPQWRATHILLDEEAKALGISFTE